MTFMDDWLGDIARASNAFLLEASGTRDEERLTQAREGFRSRMRDLRVAEDEIDARIGAV